MSDKNGKPERESDDEDQAPLAGERLAIARREQKIAVLEIAKELHLDEHKVRALESNDFDVIGAPVFAKGHLKKYAQILEVDDAIVMGEYYELTRAQAGQPALSVRPKPRQAIAPGPWLAVIAVVVVIAMAYWWFAVREPVVDEVVVGQVTPLAEELPVEEVDIPSSDPISSAVPEDEPALPAEEEVAPVSAVEASPDPAEIRLSITYTGDSWTEISDANGRRLFFDLGKAGRTVNLNGEAPFNVLFGDAANVSLLLNGAAYELPPADRRGTVRLTILNP